jgi:hypothetical protein
MMSRRIPIPQTLYQPHTKGRAVNMEKGKCKAKATDEEQVGTGPIVVSHDQIRSENWVLVTHGGAYTALHHDAEGLATYVAVNCGAKIWVPSRPKPNAKIVYNEDLTLACDDLFAKDLKRSTAKRSAGSLLLEPGDVLQVVFTLFPIRCS